MSSSTHPAVRPVVGDLQQRKLVVDYLSRRKSDPLRSASDDPEAEEPVPGGLKRHGETCNPNPEPASPTVDEAIPLQQG